MQIKVKQCLSEENKTNKQTKITADLFVLWIYLNCNSTVGVLTICDNLMLNNPFQVIHGKDVFYY